MAAVLSEIFRYPVKSMLGEILSQAQFTPRKGIPGDRGWAVRDEARGGIRGGKKIPALMTLSARTPEPGAAPVLTAPDGEQCAASDPGVNTWLSEKLNHPVTLWPQLPAEQLDHYRRGAPDHEDFEAELRSVFGRRDDEPLPDLSLFAELIEFESPPGTYFDAFPILILSRQSLASMAARAPESRFDVRRFRPNLLVDFDDADSPFPEQTWIGQTLRVGSVQLEIVGTCPRCAMTTHGFADLPRDTDVMRALVREADGNLGVYARVVTAGNAAVGDVIGR